MSRRQPYPILFAHIPRSEKDGFPGYVACAIAQARASNPDSPILVLSPCPFQFATGVAKLDDGVRWLPYEAYNGDGRRLREKYVHLSNLDREFEFRCIERWFAIREVVRRHHLDRLAHVDTDVLLYSDLRDAGAPSGCEVAQLRRNWAIALFDRPALIDEFCDLVESAYERRGALWQRVVSDSGLLHPWDPEQAAIPGNINDMYFAILLAERHPNLKVGDLEAIVDGATFDRNINVHDEVFDHDGEVKRLEWREGSPFVKYLPTGEQIRLRALHMQGHTRKQLIEPLFVAQWPHWFGALAPEAAADEIRSLVWVEGPDALSREIAASVAEAPSTV